jgi:hypothetical protein
MKSNQTLIINKYQRGKSPRALVPKSLSTQEPNEMPQQNFKTNIWLGNDTNGALGNECGFPDSWENTSNVSLTQKFYYPIRSLYY